MDNIPGSVMKPPKTISAAEFTGRCEELFEFVRRARQALLIMRGSKPIAQILPYTPGKGRGKKATRAKPLNPIEGSILYEGDIISPIDVKWDATS